jgi:hypothetical protein
MKIHGLENITAEQLSQDVQDGAKFVTYQYCVSLVVVTFKRGSDIYFIRPGESAMTKGLSFTAISLLLGWWGIPWGPIYTIATLITNFGGGKNVTLEVMNALDSRRA